MNTWEGSLSFRQLLKAGVTPVLSPPALLMMLGRGQLSLQRSFNANVNVNVNVNLKNLVVQGM
jgi:hypothetical protein